MDIHIVIRCRKCAFTTRFTAVFPCPFQPPNDYRKAMWGVKNLCGRVLSPFLMTEMYLLRQTVSKKNKNANTGCGCNNSCGRNRNKMCFVVRMSKMSNTTFFFFSPSGSRLTLCLVMLARFELLLDAADFTST